MAKVYDKMCAVKPEIRDILWAYKRNDDLGEVIDTIEKLLDDVWNEAIEKAALIVQPISHIDEERRCKDIAIKIRKLKQ